MTRPPLKAAPPLRISIALIGLVVLSNMTSAQTPATPGMADETVQQDNALAGSAVTPQMFGARCDSDGRSGSGDDDTSSMQKAIQFAESNGVVLRLSGRPTGQMCRTTAPLRVYKHITIDGDYCSPYSDLTEARNTPGAGSWLFFDHNGPGIFVSGTAEGQPSGMTFKNFCTYRAQPPLVAGSPWVPGDFDYDFSIGGDDFSIEHILMLDPTNGIYATGRFTLRDIKGSPFSVGINAAHSEDLPRIEDVHFWPFNTINAAEESYKQRNLEGLVLGRLDNPMLSNIFVLGAKTCMHFAKTPAGVTNKAKIVNLDCDLFGKTGILIDAPDVTAQIANYTAQGADPMAPSRRTTSVSGIAVSATNVHLTLDNVRVTKVGGDAIVATGGGTWVTITGLMAETWGIARPACAVSANNGATVNLGPGQLFAANGAQGTCLYGGTGTVNTVSVSKAN